MRNKTWTKKALVENLHNRKFTLVAFNSDGKRMLTYGGCNAVAMMEEALAQTKRGNTFMIFEGEVPTNGNSYDINDYRKPLYGDKHSAKEFLMCECGRSFKSFPELSNHLETMSWLKNRTEVK